jgi:hypothetical protein
MPRPKLGCGAKERRKKDNSLVRLLVIYKISLLFDWLIS